MTSSTYKANQMLQTNTQLILNQLQHHIEQDETTISQLRT